MSYWNGCNRPPKGANQADLEKHAKTNSQYVLALLWDLKWHRTASMLRAGGHRFGASLLILRKNGWDIETETYENADGKKGYRYRLRSHTPGPSEGSRVRVYADYSDVEAATLGRLTPGMASAAREALS